jgi:hypothetical protein
VPSGEWDLPGFLLDFNAPDCLYRAVIAWPNIVIVYKSEVYFSDVKYTKMYLSGKPPRSDKLMQTLSSQIVFKKQEPLGKTR